MTRPPHNHSARHAAAGPFAAHGSIRGRRVLRIDDVVTSGSQAREAVCAIIAVGAADCRFAALAKATAVPEDLWTCEIAGLCSAAVRDVNGDADARSHGRGAAPAVPPLALSVDRQCWAHRHAR